MAKKIKLPELGEGIESGDVLSILIKVGDLIERDQGILELETDKATVEVPSDLAGRVTAIHVAEGESVTVGAELVSVESEEAASAETAPQQQSPKAESKSEAKSKGGPAESETAESADQTERPTPKQSEPKPAAKSGSAPASKTPASKTPASKESAAKTPASKTPTSKTPTSKTSASPVADSSVAAGPAVRRFAREVGVDLSLVEGTGGGGRITRDDVLQVVRQASHAARKSAGEPTERDDWGPIRTERMSKIRRTIASRMHESWSAVPRVTNFDDADVTDLEQIRQASKADYAAEGIKLTALPFVIKSVALALRAHPIINAALDSENDRIIYKEYVNVGIAVDTDRGLVVPSLRGADDLSIPEIARGLADLAEAARNSSFTLDDLRGGTFTISNLGAVGGTYSTPIVNVPEVAILLLGRTRKLPVVVDDQIAIRLMMPLSLSYDHRLVDGAAAARFLNEVIGYLKAPSRLLLAP